MNEDRAFRWTEVLSVLVIIGTVIALSVPKSGEVRRAGEAQQLLADVEVVRKAVYRFYSDSAYFPVQVAGSQVPEGLGAYLPRGFSFRKPYGSLDYRNWPMKVRDTTAAVSASNVVGVTVTVQDPRIGAAAEARARGIAKFTVGNRYTFLFFGS